MFKKFFKKRSSLYIEQLEGIAKKGNEVSVQHIILTQLLLGRIDFGSVGKDTIEELLQEYCNRCDYSGYPDNSTHATLTDLNNRRENHVHSTTK